MATPDSTPPSGAPPFPLSIPIRPSIVRGQLYFQVAEVLSTLDAIEAAINRDERGDALAILYRARDGLTVMSNTLDGEDFVLILLAIDLLDRHASDELAKAVSAMQVSP